MYQPLDELYIVLITNRQSNILQDIDSLHLFAQVVTSICKSLDEREILRNAFELLSAFDELVTLGYRENLTLGQIKTFLEMESHEERIQEIIERVWQQKRLGFWLILIRTRTKNLKLAKSGRRRRSRSKFNGRRQLAVVAEWLPKHPHIPSTTLPHAQQFQIPTTPTKQRRRSRLLSKLPHIGLDRPKFLMLTQPT